MVNNAVLMGRLTKDIEMRTTASGVSVARFTLAIDRKYQKGQEKQTDFINIVCFSRTAEFAQKHFGKGNMMCVVGSIQTRSWDGQDGKKNYVTEVIADEVNFCGEKRTDSNQNLGTDNGGFIPVEDTGELLPF